MKNNLPLVSIIIPCRNEEKFIGKCLNSILANDYPKEKFEILVIDGMSSDRTREIIKEFIKKYSNIRLIDNQKKITPSALNIGIKEVKNNNIIIRIDAHSWIDKNFISKNFEYLQKAKVDCVGGVIKSIGLSFKGKVISFVMSSPFGVGNAKFRYSKKAGYVDTVAFGSYHREIFEKIGFFDETFVRHQDGEFNFRLKRSGGKIFMTPEIKSYYYVRNSFIKLSKQYFQYGYFKVKLIKKYKTIPSFRCLVPSVFILGLALLLILGFFNNFFLSSFCFLIGFYAFFLFIGAFFVSFKSSFKYFFPLILSFFILHFSYGLGFLKGIIDFKILKKKPPKDMAITR